MLTPKHTIWDESQMPYKGNLILLQTNYSVINFKLFDKFISVGQLFRFGIKVCNEHLPSN